MFKNLVILMLSFIILYLTNPNEEKFIDYYSQRMEETSENNDWRGKIVIGGKKLNAMMNVKRADKVICSIYTVSFMGEEEKYRGIATLFFEITKAEEKVEEFKEKKDS